MTDPPLLDLALIIEAPESASLGEIHAMARELAEVRVEALISKHCPCPEPSCRLWRGHEAEWEHCADLARLSRAWRTP